MPANVSQQSLFLPELDQLEALIERGGDLLRVQTLTEVEHPAGPLPVYAIELGSRNPDKPALGFIGGVHGVERIGSQVLLAFLASIVERLRWDDSIHALLEQCSFFLIPIVNPAGMWHNRRANLNGVDLMRNAPIRARDKTPFLLGGHTLSRYLPWYCGTGEMEPELSALYHYLEQQGMNRPLTVTLDCHSGFGFQDRVWFPYAGSFEPFADIGLVFRLYRMFRDAFYNHKIYRFEPQSHSYTTHGDLWDLLYQENERRYPKSKWLPLTLELGSWLWVKKNPRQLFNYVSLFNPVLPHRHRRILRRHYPLLEFLLLATASSHNWLPQHLAQVRQDQTAGELFWYYGQGSPK